MKKLSHISAILVAVTLFSCSKKSDEPQAQDPGAFKLTKISYSLEQGDGFDTTEVTLAGREFVNYGNAVLEQKLNADFSSLTKKSVFSFDNTKAVPEGLQLDTVKVPVPSNWYGDKDYTLDATLFPLSANLTELPYQIGEQHQLNITVPARSRITIDSHIDKYTLKCSFRAVFENAKTNAVYIATGKWDGTLRYNNSSFIAVESPVN